MGKYDEAPIIRALDHHGIDFSIHPEQGSRCWAIRTTVGTEWFTKKEAHALVIGAALGERGARNRGEQAAIGRGETPAGTRHHDLEMFYYADLVTSRCECGFSITSRAEYLTEDLALKWHDAHLQKIHAPFLTEQRIAEWIDPVEASP